MQGPIYKWEIAIAGLIHDIGKLYQKSDSKEVGGMKVRKVAADHPLMASDFINKHYNIFSNVQDLDIEFIRQCAQHHHSGAWGSDDIKVSKAPVKYRKYCQIINIADNLSSSERTIDEEYANKELATLVPFFVRLNDKCTPRDYAFKLTKYSDNNFRIIRVVDGKHNKDTVDKFILNFESDVDSITASTAQELFEQLLKVIKDYTWCLPAAVKESIRDVSLYQHLVTTSAIATAIYNDLVACSEDEKYNLASVETKDENIKLIHIKLEKAEDYILKSNEHGFNMLDGIIKNKSWLVDEYNCIIQDVLENSNLTIANNVISSNFESYILACDRSIDIILESIRKQSEYIKYKLGAEVYINYSIQDLSFNKVEVKGRELKHMSPVLANTPNYMKNSLEEILKSNDTWNTNDFIIKSKLKNKDTQNILQESFLEFKNSIKELGNKIAFMCIDGDKTIETMEKCFQSANIDDGTISRVSTYTNILRTFFEEYIRDSFPDEYIININSNRFIIVSSIENIVGKAQDIKTMFKEYTMSTMTLSITIHVYNINDKLVNVVEKCNSSMDGVKKKGGNYVSYQKLYLREAELQRYIAISQMVYDSCSNISALRRLATYSSMYRKYIETKDVLNLMCHPLYTRTRNKDTKTLSVELTNIIDEAFKSVFTGSKKISKELFLLETIISDVLTERRL